MTANALKVVQDVLSGPIDFEGQRLADLLSVGLLAFVGTIAFIHGYITQNVYNVVYTGLAGSALAIAVVVPAWPFFRTAPVKWLRDEDATGVAESIIVLPVDPAEKHGHPDGPIGGHLSKRQRT